MKMWLVILKSCGAKVYRTDEMGEITIVLNNKGKIRVNGLLESK